jgi:predicted Zn finger-like uncharacterized protein
MDVRCGRCGTEYEFDDALVSERGTTVKCTNCGHQFKVHPPGPVGAPERWVVRTTTGRELVYTSLRELQRGIAQRQVSADDLLSRGGQPPRALGSIAELEPFFQGQVRPASQPRTLSGVAPASSAPPPPATAPPTAAAPAAPPSPSKPPPHPSRRPFTTASGLGPAAPAQAAPVVLDGARLTPPMPTAADGPRLPPHPKPPRPPKSGDPGIEPEPPTLPRNATPAPPLAGPRLAAPAGIPSDDVVIRSASSAPPPAPLSSQAPLTPPVMTPTPAEVRDSYRPYRDELISDPRFTGGPPPSRQARSRWIAALVIVGAVGLLGATVGRGWLARFAGQPAPAATADERVAGMLEKASQLYSEGDLDGAREQLAKASVLAEKDPQLLAGLARLEAARADITWLRLRLLDPADEEEVEHARKELVAAVEKARRAADAAGGPGSDDPALVRVHVDALRLEGALDRARQLVPPISGAAASPETAYVLAALDLGEATPPWRSVIDRLRTAAAAEKDLGRARAALVYALARSGDIAGARAELARIEAAARPHPLLKELRAFVKRHDVPADAGAERKVAVVDLTSLPAYGGAARSGEDDDSETPGGADYRSLLKSAAAALAAGNADRAEQLYNLVLEKQPGNSEATAGLGDVARMRKDPETAEKAYERALKANPTYLPALIARADQKWDSGDRQGAIALYRRVLEHAGASSSYGQRAASRIAQGSGAGSSSGSQGETPSETPPAPAPTADTPAPETPPEQKPKSDQPEIDTSDLPGFQK